MPFWHVLIHLSSANATPVEQWIDALVNWLTTHTAAETNFISTYVGEFMTALEHLLDRLPWTLVVAAVGVAGWRVANWKLGAGLAGLLVLMALFGIWTDAMYTLALVLVATLLCVVIGIPLGIWMARNPTLRAIVTPILDLMQTMPSFVYLIPALLFFGLGGVPAVLSTVIYSVPPVMRLTDLGIRGVPGEMVEAAQAFGSTSRQLLTKVQLPLALPTILAGVNQTIMMALAMVVVGSMVGARGLGLMVLNGIGQLNTGEGVVGGLGIVFLAIVMDRISTRLVKTRPAGVV